MRLIVNLLENDITQTIIDNYDVSIGRVGTDINVKTINDGIIQTVSISHSDIKYCSEIKDWVANATCIENSFYKTNNKIYVCLYAPNNISFVEPSGNSLFNQILDDNYVWRYVADVKYIVDGDYIQYEQTYNDIVKKGMIQKINIFDKSEHLSTSYETFALNQSYMSGEGLSFVVESDQVTAIPSDILIQNGGENYKMEDIFVVTDKEHNVLDMASVNVYVENGEVKLESFTNGQNYDYIDIKIIGDGVGAEATYTLFAGVLTSVDIVGGSGYTWAKAIIINSEKYIIGNTTIEPLNGYNSDLKRHIGNNKYIISCRFENINQEINFYGIHRKTEDDRYKHFDNFYMIDEFVPELDEILKLKIALG